MDTNTPWRLRALDESQLDALYEVRIGPDFPSVERPNLAAMHRHMQNDLQTIWVMTDGTRDAAYAVCARAKGIILVTLLAVYKEMRGGGIGTTLLNLLREQYGDSRAIVLEVEDPADAADEADRTIRQKRIAFYERFGYQFLEGIEHVSFGVRLLLMALPVTDSLTNVRANAVQDIQAIFDNILPASLRANVVTTE